LTQNSAKQYGIYYQESVFKNVFSDPIVSLLSLYLRKIEYQAKLYAQKTFIIMPFKSERGGKQF
jgi:hypothetical protein